MEPLSYAAGYQESGARNPRTQPRAETANEGVGTANKGAAPAAPLTEGDPDSMVTMMQAALSASAPLSPRPYRRAR
jgi:hypothetical protein